jgi:hypothetical protein
MLPELLVGRAVAATEALARTMAIKDALRNGIMILAGQGLQPDSPKIQEFIDRNDPGRFLKPDGANAFTVGKDGAQTLVEARMRSDWDMLRAALKTAGFALNAQPAPGPMPADIVMGMGRDAAEAKARELAVREALRNAVMRLLGPQAQPDSPKVQDFVAKADPGRFLVPDSGMAEQKRKDGAMTVIELRMRVKLDALVLALRAAGFPVAQNQQPGVPGPQPGQPGQAQGPGQPPAQQGQTSELSGGMGGASAADWGTVTAAEKNTILKYLDTMSFMVYYNEKSAADKAMLKAAVSQANTVLTRAGITVFDIDRVERLKNDQMKVFENTSGTEVNLIQWIAQKLNADVYVQIDVAANATDSAKDGEQPADAMTVGVLTTEIFDSSTGQLLGSVPINIIASSGKSSDTASLVLNVVSQAMTQAVTQAKEQMQKALVRGMRYEMIIQNTPDSRLMNKFLQAFKPKVKQVKVLASSATEYRYEVYFIGLLSDLESLIYQVTDTIPELAKMSQVMATGKTITLDAKL